MTWRICRFIVGMLGGALLAATVHGSAPGERVICTQAPRAQWMPEAKIREIFGEQHYTLARLKISRGNCYEFYAISPDGSVVEAYYHPVSGKLLRHNRVTASAADGPAR